MNELLTTEETAELTRTPSGTLAYWRHVGGVGPKWAKLGRRVVYRRADVESWIEEQFDKVAG